MIIAIRLLVYITIDREIRSTYMINKSNEAIANSDKLIDDLVTYNNINNR